MTDDGCHHSVFGFPAVILVSSIAILGQLYRVEKRILFVEPDAGLVIALVIATLWLIYLAE